MSDEAHGKNTSNRATVSLDLSLENFLLIIHRLTNAITESVIFEKNAITLSEWAIVGVLKDDKALYLKDIVRESGVSRQRIRKVLQELEAKKLVSVSQFEQGDKRRRIVSGTAECRRIRQAILSDLRLLARNIVPPPASADASKRLGRRLEMASQLSKQLTRALKRRNEKTENFWTSKEASN